MSAQWYNHLSTDQTATAFGEYEHHKDQSFDTMRGDSSPGPSAAIATADDHEEGDVDITAGQKMLSAVTGSLFTSLLVTPLDVVRVRLQSQPARSSASSIQKMAASSIQNFNVLPPNLGITACCREVWFASNNASYCMAMPKAGEVGPGLGCAVEETQRKTFNSTFDGLRKIARNEGLATLWRGLSPSLAMAVPGNIIYFTGYDWLRFNKESPINRNVSEQFAPLLAGSMARVMAATFVGPIEMLRTRMQASRSTSGSHMVEAIAGIRQMVGTRGWTSLWRGLTLTLWRDVPFSGLYWWGYETVKDTLKVTRERGRPKDVEANGSRRRIRSRSRSRENQLATFTDSFIAGATSGGLASIVTTPFDVGKTRRQVFKDSSTPKAGVEKVLAPEERSMPRFLWHIFKEEGASGLFRGCVPRTLKVAPACAIMISSYEVGKRAFISINERAERKKGTE